MKIDFLPNNKFKVSGLTPQQLTILKKIYTVTQTKRTWDYKARKWNQEAYEFTAFECPGGNELIFFIGHIFAVCNMCRNIIDKSQLKEIQSKFINNDFKINNYYKLEDKFDIYDELDELLKIKRGVLQKPTGQGKTEVISTIVRNAVDQGLKVLILCETSPVLDEIHSRLRDRGLPIDARESLESQVIIFKPTGYCRRSFWKDPKQQKFILDRFSEIDMLLVDEAETIGTPTFYNEIWSRLVNCQYFYGFSATANKTGTHIPKDQTITEQLNVYSKSVADIFGFTVANRTPEGYNIRLVVHDHPIQLSEALSKDIHMVIRNTLNSKQFYDIIDTILKESRNVFIPVNSRTIFDRMLKDPNTTAYKMKTVLISGSGYQEWFEGQFKQINYDQMKWGIESGTYRIILGTSSSYRGIDFQKMESVLVTFDKQDALLKQIIGRVSRSNEFQIHLWNPVKYVKFLRNAFYMNKDLIYKYYSKCNINYERKYYTSISSWTEVRKSIERAQQLRGKTVVQKS